MNNMKYKSLHFDISYGCNIACPMCTFHDSKHKNEYVTIDKVKTLKDGLENFSHIHMGDGSEPFINKDWYEIICFFKSENKEVSMQTNSKIINNLEIAKQIVSSGLDRLSISIDGIDDETISTIRRGITYKEIINAIDLINQAKKELNINTPRLESNIVAMNKNLNQLASLVDILVDKNFKKIRIGFLELRSENKKLMNELLIYDIKNVVNILSKIKDKLTHTDIILDTDTFDTKSINQTRDNCPIYYERLFLQQGGRLYACYGKALLGNVFEIGLNNCLNSDEYKNFIQIVETKNNKICANCRFCRVMLFDDIHSHFAPSLISKYGIETIQNSIEYVKSGKNVSEYWKDYFNNSIIKN